MKLLRSQSGIALILVLGSLLILTTIAVEFAYNSHVAYETAAVQRDRLQAYYLARSGYNMIRLELRVEKQLRSQFANLLQNLKGTSGVTSDPLCKQIPFSTDLIKGIASGALLNGDSGDQADKKEKAAKAKEEGVTPELSSDAEKFLDFEGDFEVTCDTEERKINLNIFRDTTTPTPGTSATTTPGTGIASTVPDSGGLTPPAGAAALYENQKQLLFSLLSQKEYEPIFKGKPDDIRKVVNAIADWADRDDRINEAPGVQGSAEDSLYSGPQYHYKVKNGKYGSVAELLLVAGVGDDLFSKLEPQVTVYGSDKINLCQASDEMIKAFVLKTLQSQPGLAVISPEDTQRWELVVHNVRLACMDPSVKPDAVANAVGASIGGATPQGLSQQITTDNRYYRIESTGTVHDSHSKIIAVIDTGPSNPNLWKLLYFREE